MNATKRKPHNLTKPAKAEILRTPSRSEIAMVYLSFFVLLVSVLIWGQMAMAADDEKKASKGGENFEVEEESAQTNIEFDAGLIEDVDLRRLEFGAVTARGQGLKKKHLYRKMMTFDREMNESFREFRYQQ